METVCSKSSAEKMSEQESAPSSTAVLEVIVSFEQLVSTAPKRQILKRIRFIIARILLLQKYTKIVALIME